MRENPVRKKQVNHVLDQIFAASVHAKRIESIAGAVVGAIRGATLAVTLIGHGLAKAEGLNAKHTIKQVDRLLSHEQFVPWDYFATWVPYVIGPRQEIIVAMDWTEFDPDNHATISLQLVTAHGRTTPLLWKTVVKSTLKGWRNAYEDEILQRLRDVLPEGVRVTVIADRGFGDHKRYRFLKTLGFEYVIRFREGIYVTAEGETKSASAWVPTNGRARLLVNAQVTGKRYPVAAVVVVKRSGMKEAWCLATSLENVSADVIVRIYGKRFNIEESFRDTKDIRFGMGLAQAHVCDTDRRDRLLFISAVAAVLLTLLGAAGERLGMDRMLKANTSKKRTHSLFTQGLHYYDAMPMMPDEKLRALLESFTDVLREQRVFNQLLGVI